MSVTHDVRILVEFDSVNKLECVGGCAGCERWIRINLLRLVRLC